MFWAPKASKRDWRGGSKVATGEAMSLDAATWESEDPRDRKREPLDSVLVIEDETWLVVEDGTGRSSGLRAVTGREPADCALGTDPDAMDSIPEDIPATLPFAAGSMSACQIQLYGQ